jgi:membrane protease YdiL (CAAX protease family)
MRGLPLKNCFWNPDENRLRAGWRIILFLIIVPVMLRTLVVVIKPFIGGTLEDQMVSWVFRGVLVVITATLAVWMSRRFFDKRSVSSLGLRLDGKAILDGLVGLALSGLMVAIVFGVLLYSGLLEVKEIGWTGSGTSPILAILLWFFGIGAAVGWSEELIFRGYLLQNLRDGVGMMWAVTLSCIFYGLVHMLNPNSTLLSGLLISIIGYLRIFGWLRSSQLWLSMGMHAGWNFFQGPIFGFSFSGYGSESLIKQSVIGPDWITGGSFGPEAGIVVVPVVLLGLLVMFLWTGKRKNTPWIQRKGKPT